MNTHAKYEQVTIYMRNRWKDFVVGERDALLFY